MDVKCFHDKHLCIWDSRGNKEIRCQCEHVVNLHSTGPAWNITMGTRWFLQAPL